MQCLWKKLLIILFLNSIFFHYSFAKEDNGKNTILLILDKSSSSKYEFEFNKSYQFRNLSFELVSCKNIEFDKYLDTAALIKITQNGDTFIGWFFKYTDELNLYSNKIYEISLLDC
tara:strand:- start:36 stop:383 length:348 start_codon:yes stop_codon:yes gene_type:complete